MACESCPNPLLAANVEYKDLVVFKLYKLRQARPTRGWSHNNIYISLYIIIMNYVNMFFFVLGLLGLHAQERQDILLVRGERLDSSELARAEPLEQNGLFVPRTRRPKRPRPKPADRTPQCSLRALTGEPGGQERR